MKSHLIAPVLMFCACTAPEGEETKTTTDTPALTTGTTGGTTPQTTPSVTGPDERRVAINVSASSDGDEAAALDLALSSGINAAMIGFSWSEIESAQGVFDFSDVDHVNGVYGSADIAVTLMLNPIETDWPSVPADLEGVPFDDPQLISRFNDFLGATLEHLPDVDVQVVLIGNEVNGYLGDTGEWDSYQTLYEAAAVHLRGLRPELEIGVETMLEGMLEDYPDRIMALNTTSDVLAMTYYPSEDADPGVFAGPSVAVIERDLAALTELYTEQPIHIIEAGFPTSSAVGSSEEAQVEFVREMFRVWDTHADHVEFISFFMLHDFDEAYIEALYEALEVDEHPQYEQIFGATTSLGFRTSDGVDKLAFPVLQEEIRAITAAVD